MIRVFQFLTAGLLIVVLAYEGKLLFNEFKNSTSPTEVVEVRFLGAKSEWAFTYAGPDAFFGTADDKILGRGEDLLFPLGVRLKFKSRSEDLVYCYDVRALRLAQLVIPGQSDSIEVRLDELGSYELIPCQFCGIPNHDFDRDLNVVTLEEFNLWLRSN